MSCPTALPSNALIDQVTRGPDMNTTSEQVYELRFTSLFNEGRSFAFPCDAQGHVDLDQLSERSRANYFFARSVVGRDLSSPAVRSSSLH
jgi:hypothetical protein